MHSKITNTVSPLKTGVLVNVRDDGDNITTAKDVLTSNEDDLHNL